MSTTKFDRDAVARWYAKRHLSVDPGIVSVFYLPDGAPDREIRFVEVNEMLAERRDDSLRPVDFGMDRGADSEHVLAILDVTPRQWRRIVRGAIRLPEGWSLKGRRVMRRRG